MLEKVSAYIASLLRFPPRDFQSLQTGCRYFPCNHVSGLELVLYLARSWKAIVPFKCHCPNQTAISCLNLYCLKLVCASWFMIKYKTWAICEIIRLEVTCSWGWPMDGGILAMVDQPMRSMLAYLHMTRVQSSRAPFKRWNSLVYTRQLGLPD